MFWSFRPLVKADSSTSTFPAPIFSFLRSVGSMCFQLKARPMVWQEWQWTLVLSLTSEYLFTQLQTHPGQFWKAVDFSSWPVSSDKRKKVMQLGNGVLPALESILGLPLIFINKQADGGWIKEWIYRIAAEGLNWMKTRREELFYGIPQMRTRCWGAWILRLVDWEREALVERSEDLGDS